VRKKVVDALVKGAGHKLDTPEKAAAFCDEQLSFAEWGTFGGNTACVQIDTGGPDYLVCDLGTGVREFAWSVIHAHGPRQPQTYHVLLSHVHWDHIMGFPFLRARPHPGQPHPHLQLPRQAGGGDPRAERPSLLSCRLRRAAGRHRVRPDGARPALPDRRRDGDRPAAAAWR